MVGLWMGWKVNFAVMLTTTQRNHDNKEFQSFRPCHQLPCVTRPSSDAENSVSKVFSSPVPHLPRSLDSRLEFGHIIVHNPQKESQVAC
jgi:hypothetical protein